MVESSKILTVSYGTFSCTLEGFDDSFSTMKAIAEYFRDLAAGDRFFGAEPPTPDAQMLAHIAEQEIARRVEATSDENGIVLRAAAALAPGDVATPKAVAAAKPAEEQASPVAETQTTDPVTEAAAQNDLPDTSMMAEAVVEEADEAAQAMPPMVERPADAPKARDMAAAETAPVIQDDLPEASAATDDTAQTPPAPEEETPPLLVVSEPEAVAEAAFDQEAVFEPSATFADMETSPLVAAPVHPDANSVAAKLQRIRAVVGKNTDLDNDGTIDDGFAEDLSEPASDFDTESVADTGNIAAIMAAAAQDDTLIDTQDDDQGFDQDDVHDDGQEDDIAEDISIADDLEVDSIADIMAQAAEPTPVEEPVAETPAVELEDMAQIDDLGAVMATADDESDAEAEDAASEVTEEAPVAPRKPTLRARILRVGKPKAAETATAALMPEQSEATVDDTQADIVDDETYSVAALDGADELTGYDNAGDATLPEADEAELMAELDEVAREAAHIRAERLGRDTLPEADDAAMSRIMDQADEELSNPEGNRRRNAIAQLKAAVAATEAARQLGDNTDPQAEAESAFRDDLEQVVRPRRPDVGAASRSERPRPAPLKLVASQRVDVAPAAPDAAPVTPVRPRRVATAETATATDASNFAEFAEEMGATELPDLLEAAAAYTAFVEGVEDFSRPQIMKKVQLTTTEAFSREDGLRSFGTLLRQGRISKVRNGRFQVSDQTRFKPEQRAG